MKIRRCSRERHVMGAVQSGRWTDELSAHATRCGVCADLVLVVERLNEERRTPTGTADVPDAGLVWRRAQLRARYAATERALRPIAVVEILTLLSASVVGALALIHAAPQVQALVSSSAEVVAVGGSVAALVLGAAMLAMPIGCGLRQRPRLTSGARRTRS